MNFNFLNELISEQIRSGYLPKDRKKKIIIALSGGVDSSVSAAILKQAGYNVEAIFMKNWEEDDLFSSQCSAQKDLDDAKAVCSHLGILLHTLNFSAEYWDSVFEKFLHELARCRTPNPDILCNKSVKFDPCLKYARRVLNADFLATGHYARIKNLSNQTMLLKGCDHTKDQSYFLHTLSSEQLSQSLFPIGNLKKIFIRKIAKECKLPTAEKKDSTGICFIGPKKFSDFLSRYIQKSPGPIIDVNGDYLGEHIGLSHYTIGQRKGLKISQRAEYSGQAWYVIRKDSEKNTLVVTKNFNDPNLYTKNFFTELPHWINGVPKNLSLEESYHCSVKIRYQQKEVPCLIKFNKFNGLNVILNQQIRACTPGQSAVFYQDDSVLGGGVIE